MVQQWEADGCGIRCGDAGRLTHIVWADNFWLFGKTREELARMQRDVTEKFEERKHWWKQSSLLVMSTDGLQCDMITMGEHGSYVHKEVTRMTILGVAIDNTPV